MSLKVGIKRKFRNQEKPGETRRKSQKPAPGTRRFFNQEKSRKPGDSWLNQEVWQPCMLLFLIILNIFDHNFEV